MARKWVPTPPRKSPKGAPAPIEPGDPELAQLRESLQQQLVATTTILEQSRQLERDHRAQHIALSRRLAKLPRAAK